MAYSTQASGCSPMASSGVERGVVRRQPVAVGDHLLHQPVESRCPADDAIALPMVGVTAGDHLAGDLVDREAVHLGRAGAGVAGQLALRAPEARQIAAAHARGQEPQQHLAVGERFRRWLRQLVRSKVYGATRR